MKQAMQRSNKGHVFSVPLWAVALASLVVLMMWWAGDSTVFAQEEGGEPHEDSRERPAGELAGDEDRGGVQENTLKCIASVIGRVPTSADDLSPREQLLVARECLSGGGDQIEGGTTTPHIPDGAIDDFTRCAIAVLGRIPSENEELTSEERSRIAEKCSDFQRDGGPDSRTSAGAGEPDPETLRCIVGVLGRTPSSADDFTDNEKRLVLSQLGFGNCLRKRLRLLPFFRSVDVGGWQPWDENGMWSGWKGKNETSWND